MKNNNGNKTIGIDLWQKSSYVSPAYANVPSVSELSNSLGSIMINNDVKGALVNVTYLSSYPSDPNAGTKVHLLKVGSGTRSYNQTLADSFYFSLKNIEIGARKSDDGSCPVSLLTVKGDVWSTNAGSYGPNTSVQCKSGIEFSLGNPIIPSGFRSCGPPRSLTFRIETTNTANTTVSYKIFKDDNTFDANGNRIFNISQDQEVTLPGTQPITNLSSSTPYIGSSISYVGANDTKFDGSDAFWLVVYYTPLDGLTYSVSRLIENACASTLPVAFKSFTATKGNSAVSLRWTTATEANSKGFYVQRYYNGKWENLMFVATKSEGGFSEAELNYTYTDHSSLAGTVQYRILQVDQDGKTRFSEIRAIKAALQQSQLQLYPNPSTNGTVSIVLADANAFHTIQIIDGSGRIIRQFNAVRNTQQISSLPRGQYLAKVINQTSGESKVEKFIVLQ